MKTLGYFYYDDVKYLILKNDDEILIGKKDNNSLTFLLTDDDKRIINTVVDGLVPDGKLIKMLPMKVNGNSYNTYYCCNKNMFIFEGATGVDLTILNSLWNHQEKYVAVNYKKRVNNTYQRIIRFGKNVIVVVLAGTFALNMMSSLNKNVELGDNYNSQVAPIYGVSLDLEVEDIVEKINGNNYLSQEEKDLILKDCDVFQDNLKYFNREHVLDVLGKINTVYHDEVYEENPRYMGTFMPGSNQMDFYSASDFSNVRKGVFSHEFCHSLQNFTDTTDSWLVEGLNAIFNNEYYFKDDAYAFARHNIMALKELIGSKILRECNFNGCMQDIKNKLYEIVPDNELIDTLFAYINIVHMDGYNNSLSEEDVSFYKSEIARMFGIIYEAKFGKSMDNDLKMQYFLNYSNFWKKVCEKYGIDDWAFVNVSYQEYIFNDQKPLYNGSIMIEVTESRYEKVSYTREEAIKEGILIINEEGKDCLLGSYNIDDDGMIYKEEFVMGDFEVYDVNENNRYLDESIKR